MAFTISGLTGLIFPDGTTQPSTATTTVGALRAWVNFNGTGTVAIRASGNVSSITDNGVGNYNVNFTTNMPDGNYSAVANNSGGLANEIINWFSSVGVRDVNYVQIGLRKGGDNGAVDGTYVGVSVFR